VTQETTLRGREPAWWAVLLALAALATFVASLAATYLYLRFAAPRWPPPGIAAPPLGAAAVATGLLVATVVPVRWATAPHARGARRTLGVLVATALAAAAVVVGTVHVLDTGYAVDQHAYTSLFLTWTTFQGALVVTAVALLLGSLASDRRSGVARPGMGARLSALVWYFAALSAPVLFCVLYLGPRVFDA
jgi:heme/copper-type cytochrome/quinol oxidase subunit 3